MSAPYLGGLAITGVAWTGPNSIVVAYSSAHGTTYAYQLYAGRTLIGASAGTAARQVSGSLSPSRSPQELTILAVDPAQLGTDYGAYLPPRPYNRVRLRFTASGAAWADAERIEVSAGTEAGGAVDTDNVIAVELYGGEGEYTVTTPPLDESGTWNFEVAGRDDTEPDGNRGSALAISAGVVVYPPDVVMDADGDRLTVTVAGGEATVNYTLPD